MQLQEQMQGQAQSNDDDVNVTVNIDNTAEGVSGQDEEMVTICHKPGTAAEKTMEIPLSALPGHLDHGDTYGPCPEKTEAKEDKASKEKPESKKK